MSAESRIDGRDFIIDVGCVYAYSISYYEKWEDEKSVS